MTLNDLISYFLHEVHYTKTLKQDYQQEKMDLHTMAELLKIQTILAALQGKKVRIFYCAVLVLVIELKDIGKIIGTIIESN